jgi:Reverse transcriptase (RNA-dependent DNA polymerase).
MGSPTSGILSENFLQEIEEKNFRNFKLKYNRIILSRYLDDILIIYDDNKYIEEAIAQELNSLYKNIEFT